MTAYLHEPFAKVIADSTCLGGPRLTTMEINFHRWVLAEFNTHRQFSRNSASSRAIPLETMLERCILHPAFAVSWPREQPGMQGGGELEGNDLLDAQELMREVWESTTTLIEQYIDAHPDKSTRLHKSVINRMLEPWMWHRVIVSSTEWQNFFDQRCSPSAQPEIRVVAEMMRDVYEESTPRQILPGQFHMPLIGLNPDDMYATPLERLRASAARCARISYLTHDGQRSLDADFTLFDETLAKYGHWSPLEHQATPLSHGHYPVKGNFGNPWMQFRHLVEDYCGTLEATQFVLDTGIHPRVGMFPSPQGVTS